MKKTERAKILHITGLLLDNVAGAEMKNTETGEEFGEITSSEIRAMQVVINACKLMLLEVCEPNDSFELAMTLIRAFGTLKYDLDEDKFEGFEHVFHDEDGEED